MCIFGNIYCRDCSLANKQYQQPNGHLCGGGGGDGDGGEGQPYPDIVPLLNQRKREASLLFRKTHPHLTVHHETMMHVHDTFRQAPLPRVDPCSLLSLPPS